jgi:alpha-beta hydrolase superfamily lysophospholipase
MRFAGLVVAVVACAHTPNLPLRPDPTPQDGSTTWIFKARDDTQLLARSWQAPTVDAKPVVRGVVVIMHGLKDYSGRYAAFAQKLVARGYAVYAFDLRGHGRSAGPRVDPDRWTDYVDDLDRFLADVEKREPGKPVFLFGHSMGGAIATRTAEVHAPKLAGLMLSGPALAVDAPPLLVVATAIAGALLPGAAALKLDNHDFSSDPANAAVMDKDVLIEQGPGPARTAAGLVDGMRLIWQDADLLTMPVLAMHGTADRLTAPSGSRALIERVPAADKSLRIYDGYFHDLIHEPNGKGDKVADDMVAWLDGHTGGTAVPTPPLYAGHLGGDPRGWTQAVELAVGVTHIGSNYSSAGELILDVSRPRPLGWYGNLDAHFANGDRSISLRPLGIAFKPAIVALGVAAGMALVSGPQLAYSGKVWFDVSGLPLVHLGGFVTYDPTIDRGAGGHDELRLGGSLRLPSDRYYWPHARAGVGPVLVGGRACTKVPVGDFGCAWFALIGLELYGAD